jgi:hypothetical protein
MAHFYDDARYGVVERTWFGLRRSLGGDAASVFMNSGSGTIENVVKRWYPKGPIDVIKMGVMVVATLASSGANATGLLKRAKRPVKFYKSGGGGTAKTTLLGSLHLTAVTSGRQARYAIASDPTPASSEVEAGRFITITLATPNANDGTAAGVGSIGNGSYAFFIDWVRKFGQETQKWDQEYQG